MGSFVNPHAEKQERLIYAAMNVFGRNGYKKASIANIADEAGAAKGMINYYFGSKKNLYLYLVDLCGKYMLEEMKKHFDPGIEDFFDNMKMIIRIKISLIKDCPPIFAFLSSLHTETDIEVKDEVNEFLTNSKILRDRWISTNRTKSGFKDDVDIKLIDKLLIWVADGCIAGMQQKYDINGIEQITQDLFACYDLLKKHLYKNEGELSCQT